MPRTRSPVAASANLPFHARGPCHKRRKGDEPHYRRSRRTVQRHVGHEHRKTEREHDELHVPKRLLLHQKKQYEYPPVHQYRPQVKPYPQRKKIDNQVHEPTRMPPLQPLLLTTRLHHIPSTPSVARPAGFRYHASANHVHNPITNALSAYTSASVASRQYVSLNVKIQRTHHRPRIPHEPPEPSLQSRDT